jgi:hypothetical protein
MRTRITSQPFIKQTYDLVHLVATTGHPYKTRPINGMRQRRPTRTLSRAQGYTMVLTS